MKVKNRNVTLVEGIIFFKRMWLGWSTEERVHPVNISANGLNIKYSELFDYSRIVI